jgi:hypothetical protein
LGSSSKVIRREELRKSYAATVPRGAERVDDYFALSDDAKTTVTAIGAFNPVGQIPQGEMHGPYKYTADSFNINYLIPAITNNQVIKGAVDPSDTTYYGHYNQHNKREGFGTIRTKDGHTFSGFFVDDVPNGEGRVVFNNGDYLLANFKGNVIDGQGEIHFINKDTIYTGGFVENIPNGQGELRSVSGNTGYVGEWKDGNKHGFGTEKWEDGTIYEGNFFQGEKHGNGKFSWPDGASYDGQFKYNTIHGLGTHSWGDGRKYVGGWNNNKMHGKHPLFDSI